MTESTMLNVAAGRSQGCILGEDLQKELAGRYYGKAVSSASVELSVKTGPITIFAVTQTGDGRLKTLAAECESIPEPMLRIGNINTRFKFSLPPSPFMNAWCEQRPTHHCALCVGYAAGMIRKICHLLDLELAEVGKAVDETLVGSTT